MLRGVVLGVVVGAVPYFLIFPSIEGHFLLFVLVLFVFMFPFCYFKDFAQPATAMTGFVGAWVLIEILDAGNAQTVAFSDFASTCFGLVGFAYGLGVIWFFTPHVPEHELRAQVQRFFAACERALRGLSDPPATEREGAARVANLRHGLFGLLRLCGLWSMLLSYKHVKTNDRSKVGGLLGTLHALAFRIQCLERSHLEEAGDTYLAHAGEPAQRILDALAEAFGRMRVAAERAESAGELPDVGEEIHAVRKLLAAAPGTAEDGAMRSHALVLAGHYHAVANELAECRDRYDAIDWASWDESRF